MTIAQLIVEVGASTVKLQNDVTQINTKLDTVGTAASKIGSLMTGAFAVTAITGFISRAADAASEIHDVALKLGISTDAVQKFKFAAEQSGGTLDDVGRALNFMNKALSAGDEGTIHALISAGLSFDTIRAMKPEDAFIAITNAVKDIKDPMLQAEVAAKLFSKSALALLPGIKEGFKAIGDTAPLMSRQTIDGLEQAQDQWEAFANFITVFSAQLVGGLIADGKRWSDFWRLPEIARGLQDIGHALDIFGIASKKADVPPSVLLTGKAVPQIQSTEKALALLSSGLDTQRDATKRAITEGVRYTDALAGLRKELSGAGTIQAANEMTAALKGIIPVSQMTVEAQDKINRTMKDAREVYQAQGKEVPEAIEKVYAATFRLTDTIPLINRWGESLAHSADGIVPMIQVMDRAWPTVITNLESTVPLVGKLRVEVKSLSDTVQDNLLSAFARIPQILEQAFTSGGNMIGAMKAIGVAMADAIVTPILAGLSKVQKAAITAGTSAATALGGAAGGGMGAQVAGIAAGLGGAALAASSWGVSMAGAGMAGTVALGAATLGIGAAAVGVAILIKHLTDSKGRDAVKKFAEQFGGFDALHIQMAALGDEGEQLWIKLTQGVGKNNPKQAMAVIDEITAALERQKVKDTEVQAAAEATAAAQIAAQTKVIDQINGLTAEYNSLWDSIKSEAPEEVMGVVEEQTRARMAAVAAERENAVESLKGLTDDLAGGFDEVLKKLDIFIDRLGHIPAVNIPITTSGGDGGDGAATGGMVGYGRVLPFRLGGRVPYMGTDTVPAMLTPGEMILNVAQQKRVGNALQDGQASEPQIIQVFIGNEQLDGRMVRVARKDAKIGGTRTRAASGRGY